MEKILKGGEADVGEAKRKNIFDGKGIGHCPQLFGIGLFRFWSR
jgi:hypothetical protein